MLVPLNTTILTNFALVGLTFVHRDLWGDRVATTEQVLQEYAAHVETGKLSHENRTYLRATTLSSEERVLGIKTFPKLGGGERSYLAVVVVWGGILTTDDPRVRSAVLHRSIEVDWNNGYFERLSAIRVALPD